MEREFDVKKFMDYFSRQNRPIETKDISNWLKCTVRYVQKWCQKNEVKFRLTGGRKYYIWDVETLEKFGTWYNRKLIYINIVPRVCKRPVIKEGNFSRQNVQTDLGDKNKKIIPKEKKKIPFTTIKDILDDVVLKSPRVSNHGKKSTEFKKRVIQRWCKENCIPFEYLGGRKYYIITPEVKREIIKSFSQKDEYLVNIIYKKGRTKKVYSPDKLKIREKDFNILQSIKREE